VRLHHDFYDPSKLIGTDQEKHASFLKARTEIKDYMKAFVESQF
jgi:arsenate reductase